MNGLEVNLKNRQKLIDGLHEEIIGPKKNFSGAQKLSEATSESERNSSFYYWEYADVKEEVYYGRPERQYNSGLLYPLEVAMKEVYLDDASGEINPEDDGEADIENNLKEEDTEETQENVPISANVYLPSSMGLTVAVNPEENDLDVIFRCGFYQEKLLNDVIQQGGSTNWNFRKSLRRQIKIGLEEGNFQKLLTLEDLSGVEIKHLSLRIDGLVRVIRLSDENKSIKLVTITATNMTSISNQKEIRETENILFQCQLDLLGVNYGFQPYPNASSLNANISDEDKKFDLLYASEKNYGFGQNCSTEWIEKNEKVDEIWTTFLPEYEIKTMTPDISLKGKKIEISHASLASAQNAQELIAILEPMVIGYENWRKDIGKINVKEYYKKIFQANLDEIDISLNRMKRGMEILQSNPQAFKTFRLTNLAMLMQMTNGKEIRHISSEDGRTVFDRERENIFESLSFTSLDSLSVNLGNELRKSLSDSPFRFYKWRAFQIAFLLMTIESIVDKKSSDRELVDLIWFPTGGGKTEAYLSVAAFSILYRRIVNPTDTGTDVIMRYTLRLLTADQFQRSARLLCSLDYIRKQFPQIFGENEISLGMWVGASNTPNQNDQAKTRLNHIIKGTKPHFPIASCPWCGAELKVLNGAYHGFKLNKGELLGYCPDNTCIFHEGLPIYFVDEQMYSRAPTFLIGTIDKFVQLTWNSRGRSFFGLNNEGQRIVSPPNLIIQDELHLISGPLGTLTGIYECLIEELCTDWRKETYGIKPKIICATATIKAFDEQIRALFGRKNSKLFPPSGVDINDNFFSTIEKDERGENMPGRKYVGVHPFTQGRLQTEVQVTGSLLEQVGNLPENERDPFWTILSFYNTINDIGKALTLSEQDIPYHMKQFYDVRNIDSSKRRFLNQSGVKELTSRLDSDKVAFAISDMKIKYNPINNESLDLVLASNIIEVGVDIDRLSLMTINGQPKTTAQYIQVSGRVGRRTWERPGLVITEYNPTNSNDKSHFEHFNEYHQKLYSQVEESSVTPFSHYAIERGLPAVIIGYLRQAFTINGLGDAPDSDLLEANLSEIVGFIKRIIQRAEFVDSTEIEFLKKKANEIIKVLRNKSYESWEYKNGKKSKDGFMVRMTEDTGDVAENVFPMIFSMRSVDAQSKLVVASIEEITEEEEDLFA